MLTVDQQIDEVIQREGEYSNHPADRGGPTRWGITEKTAIAHGYRGDMKKFPIDLARSIYREIYWTLPRLDEIAPIYPVVAAELFDTGINMGPATAVRFLQRALSLLNRGAIEYPNLAVDGLVGKGTLYALAKYKQKRGAEGEDVLLKLLDGLQLGRYIEIAEKSESQEAFMYGWIRTRIGQARA